MKFVLEHSWLVSWMPRNIVQQHECLGPVGNLSCLSIILYPGWVPIDFHRCKVESPSTSANETSMENNGNRWGIICFKGKHYIPKSYQGIKDSRLKKYQYVVKSSQFREQQWETKNTIHLVNSAKIVYMIYTIPWIISFLELHSFFPGNHFA